MNHSVNGSEAHRRKPLPPPLPPRALMSPPVCKYANEHHTHWARAAGRGRRCPRAGGLGAEPLPRGGADPPLPRDGPAPGLARHGTARPRPRSSGSLLRCAQTPRLQVLGPGSLCPPASAPAQPSSPPPCASPALPAQPGCGPAARPSVLPAFGDRAPPRLR